MARGVLGLTVTLMIVVPGCREAGSSSGPGPAAPPQTTLQGQPPSTPAAPPSASRSASASNEALLQAGETALAKVAGTVISIEEEDRGARWKVQVVTTDGTEHELETSADGKRVVRGPTPDDDDDAADLAKHRQRVADAKIDFRKAVEIITGATPGRITELDLDSHNGATVWEADVVDDSQTKREVKIDASTGAVLP